MTHYSNNPYLPPGSKLVGRSETPVYASDGKTVIYTSVTLRYECPADAPMPPAPLPPNHDIVITPVPPTFSELVNAARQYRYEPPPATRAVITVGDHSRSLIICYPDSHRPAYSTPYDPNDADKCPHLDSLQTAVNILMIQAYKDGLRDGLGGVTFLLTRKQADRIAATREYRSYCLGAPDALRYDAEQVKLNHAAHGAQKLWMGNILYGIRVEIAPDPVEPSAPLLSPLDFTPLSTPGTGMVLSRGLGGYTSYGGTPPAPPDPTPQQPSTDHDDDHDTPIEVQT